MRREFLANVTRSVAIRTCPWAAKIVKVDGGYMAFESLDDYQTWKNQR
jgi:hypothetical protein